MGFHTIRLRGSPVTWLTPSRASNWSAQKLGLSRSQPFSAGKRLAFYYRDLYETLTGKSLTLCPVSYRAHARHRNPAKAERSPVRLGFVMTVQRLRSPNVEPARFAEADGSCRPDPVPRGAPSRAEPARPVHIAAFPHGAASRNSPDLAADAAIRRARGVRQPIQFPSTDKTTGGLAQFVLDLPARTGAAPCQSTLYRAPPSQKRS